MTLTLKSSCTGNLGLARRATYKWRGASGVSAAKTLQLGLDAHRCYENKRDTCGLRGSFCVIENFKVCSRTHALSGCGVEQAEGRSAVFFSAPIVWTSSKFWRLRDVAGWVRNTTLWLLTVLLRLSRHSGRLAIVFSFLIATITYSWRDR